MLTVLPFIRWSACERAGSHPNLARADRLSLGAAERGKEVIRRVATGDLHGVGSRVEAAELVLGLGHLADDVEQALGLDATQVGVCEVLFFSSLELLSLC